MKTKEKKELHLKKIEELKKMLKEAQLSLFIAKLDHKQNKLKNTSSISMFRKNIALLKTILNIKAKEAK